MFDVLPSCTIAQWGNPLWAQLGQRFLREIYRGMLHPYFSRFCVRRTRTNRRIHRWFRNTSTMMKQVFLSRFHRLSVAGILGLRNPAVIKHLDRDPYTFETAMLRTVMRYSAESSFARSLLSSEGKVCRVTSTKCSSIPYSTKGIARSKSQRKRTTKVPIVSSNLWGFEQRGLFHFYGKEMILYVLDLLIRNG